MTTQELVRWWEAVHFTVLRRRCAEAGMHNLAAKQATSILRYIGAVPADKAFYEAGEQHALSATLAQATRVCVVPGHVVWALACLCNAYLAQFDLCKLLPVPSQQADKLNMDLEIIISATLPTVTCYQLTCVGFDVSLQASNAELLCLCRVCKPGGRPAEHGLCLLESLPGSD